MEYAKTYCVRYFGTIVRKDGSLYTADGDEVEYTHFQGGNPEGSLADAIRYLQNVFSENKGENIRGEVFTRQYHEGKKPHGGYFEKVTLAHVNASGEVSLVENPQPDPHEFFLIVFDHPTGGKLYLGKSGTQPVASKASAKRFHGRKSVEERMNNLRTLFAHNPDWDMRLVNNMKAIQVEG